MAGGFAIVVDKNQADLEPAHAAAWGTDAIEGAQDTHMVASHLSNTD